MSSIMWHGSTYHGLSVDGHGVFANEYGRRTYAGQHRDGYACGLAVVTCYGKVYAEHGPDGKYDGRHFERNADGDTRYSLFERGARKDYAIVYADGRCMYNRVGCSLDDPRFLALTAQVAPVEVRRAAPAPHPQSSPTHLQGTVRFAGSCCPRRCSRPPLPPRYTPTPHAVAGRCATQPSHQSHCNA